MKIILIGMRGTGKTTVGKILAKKLTKQFIETDKLIEKMAKLTTSEIVNKLGWEKFRDLEEDVISEISNSNNSVIATGGGAVLRKNNINALGKNGYFVLLLASVDTMLNRIGDYFNRPFLTDSNSRKDDIEKTLRERGSLYKKVADYIIDTEGKTPDDIVKQILTKVINYD